MEIFWCQRALSTVPNIFYGLFFCKIHTNLLQGSHFNLTLNIMTVTPHLQTNLFVDVSIPVDIIEVEGPLELLSDRAPQQDGQSRHKVLVETHRRSFVGDWPHYLFPKKQEEAANLKLYGARMSWVKGIEQEVCVGAGVCEQQQREKVSWVTRETPTAQCKLRLYLHVERTGRRSAWRFLRSLHHWDTPAVGRGRGGEDA